MMLNSTMYSKRAQYVLRCQSARQTQTHKLSLSREGDLHMLVGAGTGDDGGLPTTYALYYRLEESVSLLLVPCIEPFFIVRLESSL